MSIDFFVSLVQSMSAGLPAAFIIAHFVVSRDRIDLVQGLFGNANGLNIPWQCCLTCHSALHM